MSPTQAQARERAIKAWLAALSARTNAIGTAETHHRYAEHMCDMLDMFSFRYFTESSYKWVASECPKGTPNAAQLIALLTQWGRENPDNTPRLTDPTTDGWDAMDHKWFDYWQTRERTNFEPVRIGTVEFKRTTREQALSLVKAQSPKAYARIIGDKEAHENEVDRQWWLDRIARFEREYRNPTARWRELVGMREVLTREDAHPRPFVIHRLDLAIQDAEAAGADTNPAGVYRASQNLVESVSRMLRAATTGRAQRPSGGL